MSQSTHTTFGHLAKNPAGPPKYSVKLEKLGVEVTDPRAIRSLIALMDMHAVIGGAACHWGGPSALAEILSATHQLVFTQSPWQESYNLINDIGHGENAFYAIRALYGFDGLEFSDLKKFRSIESRLTGHGESHLNPGQVLLSNGPLGSAFAQSQGLAMADHYVKNSRTTICFLSDGAAMEGEAKEGLAAIPGLRKKGQLNPYVLILSDNNTKLSGRISEDTFSMLPSFDALQTLGWKVIEVSDGHDLQACYQAIQSALKEAKTLDAPICLRVKTIKGYGIDSTAKSSSGGHGFPLKKGSDDIIKFIDEIWNGETPEEFKTWAKEVASLSCAPAPKSDKDSKEAQAEKIKKEKVQVGISNALIKAFDKGIPVISLTSDLPGSTGVGGFRKHAPQASFDVGIAESNMVSSAAGFALNGQIPVVDTFAAFGATKGNLPLIMNELSGAHMIAIYSHCGFQDAADGASHQSLTYFSALAAIPNVVCLSASTSQEADWLMTNVLENWQSHQKSFVFFIGRENFPQSLNAGFGQWHEDLVTSEGSDGVIVSQGATFYQANQAAEELRTEGKLNLSVVNRRFLNQVPTAQYAKLLTSNQNRLISIEDHQRKAGMGDHLISELLQANVRVDRFLNFGVEGVFGRSAYTADELYDYYNLSASKIKDRIIKGLAN